MTTLRPYASLLVLPVLPVLRVLLALPVLLGLQLAAGPATAQTPLAGAAWASYRDTYRGMVVFEKYGSAKNLIVQHLQVAPRTRGVSMEGVQLTLSGKTVQLNLALDAAGRTAFPLLKAAYDENAALVLNRAPGQYTLRPRISIVPRADGVYEGADLRAACAQVLAYQRYSGAQAQSKKCAGVRFAFLRTPGEALLRLRKGAGAGEQPLAATDGALFADENSNAFKVIDVRFADLADKAQVVAPSAPLAISALIE